MRTEKNEYKEQRKKRKQGITLKQVATKSTKERLLIHIVNNNKMLKQKHNIRTTKRVNKNAKSNSKKVQLKNNNQRYMKIAKKSNIKIWNLVQKTI